MMKKIRDQFDKKSPNLVQNWEEKLKNPKCVWQKSLNLVRC